MAKSVTKKLSNTHEGISHTHEYWSADWTQSKISHCVLSVTLKFDRQHFSTRILGTIARKIRAHTHASDKWQMKEVLLFKQCKIMQEKSLSIKANQSNYNESLIDIPLLESLRQQQHKSIRLIFDSFKWIESIIQRLLILWRKNSILFSKQNQFRDVQTRAYTLHHSHSISK